MFLGLDGVHSPSTPATLTLLPARYPPKLVRKGHRETDLIIPLLAEFVRMGLLI